MVLYREVDILSYGGDVVWRAGCVFASLVSVEVVDGLCVIEPCTETKMGGEAVVLSGCSAGAA